MGELHEHDGLERLHVVPRHRGVRPVFLLTLALVMAIAVLVTSRAHRARPTAGVNPAGADWFSQHKPHCNALEVASFLAVHPPAPTADGAAQRAACLAVTGKLAEARQVLLGLPPSRRNDAVNNVFLIAHPVADAGDDASAGPIMELVIEFQPDQYMALYHAGMAKAIAGDDATARRHMTRFLEIYQHEDGWSQNAHRALQSLDRPRMQRIVKQGSEGSIVY